MYEVARDRRVDTVSAGALALPIAFATVGPLAGVGFLVVLGLLNLLTVTYLAETRARNESVRYGNAFVGQLVADFLGPSAALIMRITLFSYCCIILVSYYTGFASALSAATGLPAPLWVVVICGIGLVLIACKSLTGTFATAAVVLVAICIYCFWTISIGSTINSERLHTEAGTALVPLAEKLGSGVLYLGIVFAVLGFGMSSIHYGLGIFNLTREFVNRAIKSKQKPSWWRDHAATIISFVPILAVFVYVQ